MQISPESMHDDVSEIYQQQKEIGYESHFIEGETACSDFRKQRQPMNIYDADRERLIVSFPGAAIFRRSSKEPS